MSSLRVIFLSLAVVLLSAPLWSDQAPVNDPRIIIGSGSGSLGVGETFLFSSATGTSPATSPCVVNGVSEPDCVFRNDTTSTFTSLSFDIDEVLAPGSELSCGTIIGGPFTTCTIGPDSDGYFATFTGGSGVAPNGDFGITVEGWNPNSNFGVGANGMIPPDSGTPEPGTIALLLTGIGALALAFRKSIFGERTTLLR